MSTLWTPSGERPVGSGQAGRQPAQPPPTATAEGREDEAVSEEELRAQMEQMRQQLIDAPAEVVVANHCFGLFELAALHMSNQPPQLSKAKLAIDALGALLDGLAGRLGEAESQLRDGLASLRLAYVQLQAGNPGGEPAEAGSS
jgi:hypothetical protein